MFAVLLWAFAVLFLAVFWVGRLLLVLHWRIAVPQKSVWRKGTMLLWLLLPLLIAASFGLARNGAFFRARFALSRPALERFVQAAPETSGPAEKRWVGLFEMRVKERQGDTVWMITGHGFVEVGGLVWSPDGEPPKLAEHADEYSPIEGGWWKWRRD